MAEEIKITGVQQTIKAFGALKGIHERKIADGLMAAAGVVYRKSQKYVPVDTQALKKSGQVQQEGVGFGGVARVVYGGPDAPYALWVHEIMDAYHAPPTCAKFLEKAARETKGAQTNALGRAVKGDTQAIVNNEVEDLW